MANEDYLVCVRNLKKEDGRQVFGSEPGPTRFLAVPAGRNPGPEHGVKRADWVGRVLAEAESGTSALTGRPTGDVLVFVHGYNNGQEVIMKRHRRLKQDLAWAGYQGAVVSYDWPSAEAALNYLEDRDDAKDTARRLRDDCITLFSARQARGCEINVHLLAHSTGAFVIRHAFSDADEKESIKQRPWTVSQVALIGADVSSRSMSREDSKSRSLYRHCVRLTNYCNPFDSVLKLSNTKRIGLAPRVGRVGLPEDRHPKALDVDCGAYFEALDEDRADYYGTFCHSWHIGDRGFARDLCYVLQGDIDRHRIPTRGLDEQGRLILRGE